MDILFAGALALKARVLSREAMQTRAMWLAFLHLKLSVFDSTGPGRESFQGLVFGCTIDSKEVSFAGDSNQISGVMGLGFGPKKFVNQLDSQGQSNGRFSYCLRRERTMGATNSFIRFGADIEQGPDPSVTELKRNNNIVLYYINLIGISVNGYMLNIPEQEFEIKKI
ncbi:aspartic proteinase nepenthesin-2-like [Prunus yedoensis var. nudiflora]|uniref:Aspartic proteinase nepenthesin-2-like n=1 Tax=Prunus yedoensis var. nudiflora TaxID=2094558 RepID=A0A314UBQ8_PRUYE|nr:aspartic proteinase nepenthesin-2-like [Prunus yedoensis var. nudiflora]